MGNKSDIERTDATWDPVTGCTKLSPGCKNCYAEKLALRLQAMGQQNYTGGFRLALHPAMLECPAKWHRPRRVFVNSMSDLFHEEVPLPYIQRVFDVMGRADWHRYHVLTKPSARLLELNAQLNCRPQIWMGVSVENNDYLARVDHLRQTDAHLKFLSV